MRKNEAIQKAIVEQATRFESPNDLDEIVELAGESNIVLLGEATHGTSEFYQIRAELTKKLIKEKGFTIVAVEGDWPSCFKVNEFIKGYNTDLTIDSAFHDFNRWPTWMWANEEVKVFIEWLKKYNQHADKQAGFYGIDVYSLWESVDILINELKRISPADVEAVRKAYSCFEPFNRNSESYAISAAFYGENCTEEVVRAMVDLQKKRSLATSLHEEQLNLDINALVMLNAERYYRAMAKAGPESWNIRDYHMVDALEKMIASQSTGGHKAKAIVWEHNTHIGDARATDMVDEGLINVGQVLREKYSQETFSVGFGTHRGTVIAAREWGGKVEVLPVPQAKKGSWEDCLHQAGSWNKYLIFDQKQHSIFNDILGHRAIGVVYNPEVEHLGNYVPSKIASRYDAFIYIDETRALSPLSTKQPILL